tara:strand:- start:520 stop:1107 length:588 start_codon:yes stop_codon:yes gene_type:complete
VGKTFRSASFVVAADEKCIFRAYRKEILPIADLKRVAELNLDSVVERTNYFRTCRLYLFPLVLFLLVSCVTNEISVPTQAFMSERLVGVGYAVINAQPGSTPEEKRLMAIKASKLEAYKSLAEQIYGQYLESRGTLNNLTLGEEQLVSRVEGLIVGARVVSIKPISTDSYETTLEIGWANVNDLIGASNELFDDG